MSYRFRRNIRLKNGDLVANVIINNPHSYAAQDAALSKMNPKGLKLKRDEIIQNNINILYDFCQENPSARINLYLTDICLPYGIMFGENYSDPSTDFMKVDIYSPLGNDQDDVDGYDNERLSFYILADEDRTRDIYNILLRAVSRVKNDKTRTKKISLHKKRKTEWILKKPFIHRGKYRKNTPDHSIRGFLDCLKNEYPMEIDVFSLKSGEIVVGRNERIINKDTSSTYNISEFSFEEFRKLCTDDYVDSNNNSLRYRFEEMMTLSELLDMINGKIDLLIEVKTEGNESPDTLSQISANIVKCLRYYTGRYAIHSANPYILKNIRDLDRIVVLGQISWSFKNTSVTRDFQKLHTEYKFLDVFVPDFISYSAKEISGNTMLRNVCDKYKLPLLAWAITDKEGEMSARDNKCDNIIIEGAPTYISS